MLYITGLLCIIICSNEFCKPIANSLLLNKLKLYVNCATCLIRLRLCLHSIQVFATT